MRQKSNFFAISSVIILSVLLAMGCLSSEQQHPAPGTVAAQCTESLMAGHSMTVNETQDGATICAKSNSTFTLELTDASRTGNQWIINASPGLHITDEGVTFYHYYMNGTPLTEEEAKTYNGPRMELGLDRWNVSIINTGIQTINATLQYYITSEPRTERSLNWTVVVS